MTVDIQPAVIQTFLQEGGMPSALSQQCVITPVDEGGLAVTFKIECSDGVFYLKFHDAEGARGSPFLKHLLPINDLRMREHAEKRRHFVRKLLDSVIAQRSTLVPQPCYFDLRPFPMALQKLRRQKEHVEAELRIEGENCPSRLAGMVGTVWKEAAIQHIPTSSPEQKNVWDPIDYSPESVFRCTATIGELQEKSENFLKATIQRKVQTGKGSFERIQDKLCHKLQHEQRSLMDYETLTSGFFSCLGLLDVEDSLIDRTAALKAFGQRTLEQVEIRILQTGVSSIAELQACFLTDLSIPSEYAQLSFQKLLFVAERERWWTLSKRQEGKALDQLQQAELIAKELSRDPTRFLSLVEDVLKFKTTYQRLEKLPQAIVPQDAHPFNFFIHQTDGATTMLDLEDMSMGVRFADLSTVYVFKILRGVVQRRISEGQALELLQATINGYNSTTTSPLTREEMELMADYAMGLFLNFLPQFGTILRMDPNELDTYNLGMSSDAFMQQFQLLKQISQLWRHLQNLGSASLS